MRWGAGVIPALPPHFCTSHLAVLHLELEMKQVASVRQDLPWGGTSTIYRDVCASAGARGVLKRQE